ncbi:type II toxin-antitoxin system RelE/ParE family toxin [Selenomonas bovis]|uniref:Type II toxin-antitoxin system RelE/ParE family toxin n=1 Tax=Selenomonas bovis TaxID=416586 RepID=A0A848BDX6_9FIRM|nr:type II toxin-antitoxin system RelE/ParE family toxin [Selenomonas bovis]NMD99231.1 type II toxin-antitoxin system RelE/ParE family toxin [Selenomonas bovis]
MNWFIRFLPQAQDDFDRLDGSQQKQVATALYKVSANPLPYTEGGYGKPLGHHTANNLTGLLKVKLRKAGLRIVYQLERRGKQMIIVIIDIRDDERVYRLAEKRLKEL